MMQADRIALCGPKGVPDATRRAVRGATTASQVVLGGQRIAVRRPRAHSVTEGELALRSFEWAAGGDPLDAATMAAIAAGVSTRRYASTQEPVPAAHRPRAASKSAVRAASCNSARSNWHSGSHGPSAIWTCPS